MAGLAEFMDRNAPPARDDFLRPTSFRGLGDQGEHTLASSGPYSQLIARAASSPELAEHVLATLFWWCYVRTDRFSHVSDPLGDPADQRRIIVSHERGTRQSLLILAPDVRGPVGTAVAPIERDDHGPFPSSDPRSITGVALAERGSLEAMLASAGIDVDPPVFVLAVSEIASRDYFSLVVAPTPEEALTAAPPAPRTGFVTPAPALPVTIAGRPGVVATAGVLGADAAGGVLAITARHAIADAAADGTQIFVGEMAVSVVKCHEVTDSCVLAVAGARLAGVGHAGLLSFAPTQWRPALFTGAASGFKQTLIRGYDLSVLDTSPYLGSKVYTNPDTIPGDSGSALIDSDDHIVGFAVSRTALGALTEFATWSWAPQVLAAHGLA